MNVQYDFSQMAVGKYDKEADYIQKKKAGNKKIEIIVNACQLKY